MQENLVQLLDSNITREYPIDAINSLYIASL